MRQHAFPAFTLAELLMALLILGVISTYTIPKVLVAQRDTKYEAMGKEVAGMISGAYMALQHGSGVSSATKTTDLLQYMNYTKVDTASIIDFNNGDQSRDCSDAATTCIRLHNGGIIRVWNSTTFGGTATTNALGFVFDPNGRYDGTTGSPGKAVQFWLYYNGKLRTWDTMEANTYSGGALQSTCSICDPSWFSWD